MTDELVYEFTEIAYGAPWGLDLPEEHMYGIPAGVLGTGRDVNICTRFIDVEKGDEYFITNDLSEGTSE